ncbi:MAG: hypothetical protein ACRD2P_01060, partial [Terriglobia bacterium]
MSISSQLPGERIKIRLFGALLQGDNTFMLDLAFVRDNLGLVRQKLADRGGPDLLSDFESLDRERRKLLVEA